MVFILLQSFYARPRGRGAIVAVQIVLIPRLRRRLLVLGRERQLTARQLAGRVGEIVEGITAIRVNDTSNWERAEIAGRLGRIFFIRFDIYQWKFLVKFINNLLAQVTPFIFYLVGGYLAITGRLDIGQLVAVIAAYKDLPSPLKDLIDWDQQRLDVQVKYTQVVEQFAVDARCSTRRCRRLDTEPPPHIEREIAASNLVDPRRFRRDAARLDEPASEAAARRSPRSGRSVPAANISPRRWRGSSSPPSGRVLDRRQPIETLPEAMTGRRIGYVEAAHLFPAGHARATACSTAFATHPLRRTSATARARRCAATRRSRSGNIEYSTSPTTGSTTRRPAPTGPDDLLARVREVLAIVDLEDDVYRLGLRSRLPEPSAGGLSQPHSGGARRFPRAPRGGSRPSTMSRCSIPTATWSTRR